MQLYWVSGHQAGYIVSLQEIGFQGRGQPAPASYTFGSLNNILWRTSGEGSHSLYPLPTVVLSQLADLNLLSAVKDGPFVESMLHF